MKTSKQALPFYALLLTLFLYPSLAARLGSQSQRESEPSIPNRKAARLTQARAEAVARRTAPSDPLLHSRLELEQGNLVYEVALLDPGQRWREILVDAGNGRILSNQVGREQ